jgi:hypothetical protein
MNKESKYREQEKKKAVGLIKNSQIFRGDVGRKPYPVKDDKTGQVNYFPKADLLLDGKNNLFCPIVEDVIFYFTLNGIAFWKLDGDIDGEYKCNPTGHVSSSQIACINHLFPLRYDKEAVLQIAKAICPDFKEVLEIGTDKFLPAYISFEVVSNTDHLNESKNEQKLTRGTMCTSVDALIYVLHKNGKKYLIPIEWKYTECYDDKDYSVEDRPNEKTGTEGKGKERLSRYADLITKSQYLKSLDNYKNSIYFFEPFYQLMRQTLWAEQMIINADKEVIKADDFFHIHVIPNENKDLLNNKYECGGKEMEETWRSCLTNQEKYQIITSEKLLENVDKIKYKILIDYLSERYWK